MTSRGIEYNRCELCPAEKMHGWSGNVYGERRPVLQFGERLQTASDVCDPHDLSQRLNATSRSSGTPEGGRR